MGGLSILRAVGKAIAKYFMAKTQMNTSETPDDSFVCLFWLILPYTNNHHSLLYYLKYVKELSKKQPYEHFYYWPIHQ